MIASVKAVSSSLPANLFHLRNSANNDNKRSINTMLLGDNSIQASSDCSFIGLFYNAIMSNTLFLPASDLYSVDTISEVSL